METKISNIQNLNAAAKAAKEEVKSVAKSHLYYVHQLNKLAKRNEFIDGVNLAAFGERVKEYSGESDLFTLRVFTPDKYGRPCYRVKVSDMYKGLQQARKNDWQILDDEDTYLHPITPSLSGLITAYKYILSPAAKAADKAEREAEKALKAEIRKAAKAKEVEKKKAAAAAAKAAKKSALSDYKAGRITAEQFAGIMAA